MPNERTEISCSVCHTRVVQAPDGLPGYGVMDHEPVCYACCADIDRRFMTTHGIHTGLYVHGDVSRGYEVTNWPGTLRFSAISYRSSPHGGGFGSPRLDLWFPGPDGFLWHAVRRGHMDLARARRTKTACPKRSPA